MNEYLNTPIQKNLRLISVLTKYLGVAQSGQSPWFGTKLSKVRIFPPRPDNRTKVVFLTCAFLPPNTLVLFLFMGLLGSVGYSSYSKR